MSRRLLIRLFINGDAGEAPSSPAQLANIATRGRVGSGENVMIGGLIVSGSNASRVLVRAIAPSPQDQLDGALQDPLLELRDINGGLIAVNDDWRQIGRRRLPRRRFRRATTRRAR